MASADERALRAATKAIEKAFVDAVVKVATNADVNAVAGAIPDVDAVVSQASVDGEAMADVLEQVRKHYKDNAQRIADKFKANFDIMTTGAAAWLEKSSSELITRISKDQKEAVQTMLAAGLDAGKTPEQVALDVVGRVSHRAGRRTGGVIGLNGPQTGFVVNARQQLESGDPSELRKYLTRTRRDKRFDKSVQKAIDSGTGLSQGKVDRMVTRYSDRLLQTRGNTIGRTEGQEAISSAQDEAWKQQAAKGRISEENTKRVWVSIDDSATRHLHAEMDGQERGLHEPFEDSNGNQMMFPGDTSLGAAADTIIGCRCVVRVLPGD